MSTLVPPAPSRSTLPTAQAANEPTVFGTSLHDGNGGETDPVSKCAEPQVHGRGFSPLPVDHDEDMDKEMQERNSRAGMVSEPALNGDDDDVASSGSGKRGCGMDSEPEKNSHDDEVPSSGSGNRLDKPIASASGVAEVDGK
ncbi:Molybdate-anion transporter [Olea europaea subsp. europaea]|uniref:Molybdate-anion transporter n=1 Tax=Olea europaea subsp. europaea TaxID=158383 RepID=A0A8S0T7Z1_OLEEU|nr:Molybdate-anion transporter [Olea europaea subsp. europaea]